MSVAESINRVFVEVGVDKQVDVTMGPVGSADFDIRQVVGFLNQSGRDAVQRAEWPETHTVITVPGGTGTNYILPDEVRTVGTGVSVRLSDGRSTRAVLNPSVWQQVSGVMGDNPYVYAREDNTIECTENLDNARIVVFNKNWVRESTGGRLERIVDFSDFFLLPERIVELGAVWRWKRSKGRPYEGEFDEFEREIVVQARNVRLAI